MRRAALLLTSVVLCGAASPSADRYGITTEEHAACDADAMSLCAQTFPDQDLLLACMKQKHGQLSSSCAPVFRAGLKRRHMSL